MGDYFRYVFFRTETWTFTGSLVMICIYLTLLLDVSRPRDNAGTIIGTLLTGAVCTGLAGGCCAALWQLIRLITGHHPPKTPGLRSAIAAARPGMLKGAFIGSGAFLVIAFMMTGLFVLTNERTGTLLGFRIAWIIGCGVAGAALGAGIASIGGLSKQVYA